MKLNWKMKRRRPEQNSLTSCYDKKFINNHCYESQEYSHLMPCDFNNPDHSPVEIQTEPLVHQAENDLRDFILRKKQNATEPGIKNDQNITCITLDSSQLTPDIISDYGESTESKGVGITVTITNDNMSSGRQVVVNDNQPSSNDVKKLCISCPKDPYLICQNTPEILIHSLKLNPPKFVQEINAFNKTHKLCSSLKIYCSNCSSGPMPEFYRASEHFRGKAHKHKVKGDNNNYLKITLCSTCYNIWCTFSPHVNSNHKDLPDDLSDLLKKIFPLAKVKGSVIEVKKPQNKINLKKKSTNGVDLIFKNFSKDRGFKHVFGEVVKFGSNLSLILQGMVFLKKATDPFLCSAFCRYNRNTTGILKDKLHIQGSLLISGSCVSIEHVPSFDGMLENIILQNINDPAFTFVEWNVGRLSPSCEIFKQWDHLSKLIDSKIELMNETSKTFYELTSSISYDLMRSVSNRYHVKAIHFFGSRVTGLALAESDFDLQISTGDFASVRAICDRCFNHSPWFIVKHIIPWAKVPVIKLLHLKTQTVCDISLNNVTGVINSQLLRFYLEMDERVKWLIVIVKMWASMNLITGSHSFTSYALAWLVLFFLMQKQIFLVPNVQLLTQHSTNPYSRNLLYSEETGMAFNLDMREVLQFHNPKSTCIMTKFQLLSEFFKYCLEVMPMKNVLDPFTGEMFSRQILFDSNRRQRTTGNLNNDKNVKIYSLIIMDPIVHSSNISASVTNRSLDNFIYLAKETLDYLSKSSGR